MFLLDLLFALIIALILATVLSAGYRRRRATAAGAWPLFLIFFLLLLFATWAGGIWLVPFGPLFMGAYWMPFIVAGIIVWLLIAVLAWEPTPPRLNKQEGIAEERAAESGIAVVLTIFFSIVLDRASGQHLQPLLVVVNTSAQCTGLKPCPPSHQIPSRNGRDCCWSP